MVGPSWVRAQNFSERGTQFVRAQQTLNSVFFRQLGMMGQYLKGIDANDRHFCMILVLAVFWEKKISIRLIKMIKDKKMGMGTPRGIIIGWVVKWKRE